MTSEGLAIFHILDISRSSVAKEWLFLLYCPETEQLQSYGEYVIQLHL